MELIASVEGSSRLDLCQNHLWGSPSAGELSFETQVLRPDRFAWSTAEMINRHYARSSKTIIAESAAELKRLRQDLDYTTQQIASSQLVIEEALRTLQSSTDVAQKRTGTDFFQTRPPVMR